MGSLYRLFSLDCVPSPRGTPLRHPSLPSHYLFQSEVAIGALAGGCSSPTNASAFCRASAHPGFNDRHVDDIREFEKALKEAAEDRPLFGTMRRQLSAPRLDGRKKQGVSAPEAAPDMVESVVYSELRECSYSWRAPPSFCKPDEGADGIPAPLPALHCPPGMPDQHSLRSLSDLRMQTGGGRNGVKDRPMSLRMLKRKLSKVSTHAQGDLQCKPHSRESGAPGLPSYGGSGKAWPDPVAHDGVGAVSAAFASLLHMLKLVQQYAFITGYAQPHASVGADAADENLRQNWVSRAHAEMLDSFLWLFQQVFSCTPGLMLVTMILLADFTSHSLSKHVALPVMRDGEHPSLAVAAYDTDRSAINGLEAAPSFNSQRVQSLNWESRPLGQSSSRAVEGGAENSSIFEVKHNGDSCLAGSGRSSLQSDTSIHVDEDDVGTRISASPELLPMVERPLLSHVVDAEGIRLDKTIKKMLVAPVFAPVLEADDYPCFDRTDLAYQYEISKDPSNPLLLLNYAQFLHVVRHDIARAEKFYRRAALVDRDADGEVLWRFASFLWVAKGDVVAADIAYKAALAADPDNKYHAGSYAHFLWILTAGQAEEICCCS